MNNQPLAPNFPRHHRGPVVLPGTGRIVWWTGKVAIGLRHQPQRATQGASADWLQKLMLGGAA